CRTLTDRGESKRNPLAEQSGGHGIDGEERRDEAQGARRRGPRFSRIRLMLLLCCRSRSRKQNRRKPQTSRLHIGREPLAWSFGDSFGGGGYGPGPYRIPGGFGGSSGGYGVGAGEFGGGYGGFDRGLRGILGESSLGYSSRLGSYG
ncbi:hypothetical protein GW17_00009631, partial [Ensete ventricosum]